MATHEPLQNVRVFLQNAADLRLFGAGWVWQDRRVEAGFMLAAFSDAAIKPGYEGFSKHYSFGSPEYRTGLLNVLLFACPLLFVLPAAIWHSWKDNSGIDIIDGIGSTELYHIFISNRPGDIRPGSSGKPFEGYELKIVDEEGRDVARGEIGNLLVKGETAALSYLHNYEASRKTFLGEWLFTGDKYYVDDDGYYWHAGRSDDMMKVGGIWVSPVEVEATLVSHPAVLEVAVVGESDKVGLTKPKAFVVLNEGYGKSADLTDELIQYCKDNSYEYTECPRYIRVNCKAISIEVKRIS